ATPPSALYTLSLHDALPIYLPRRRLLARRRRGQACSPELRRQGDEDPAALGDVDHPLDRAPRAGGDLGLDRDDVLPVAQRVAQRSEEHTSELQSRFDLVCRL